jgi:hypothetical protein
VNNPRGRLYSLSCIDWKKKIPGIVILTAAVLLILVFYLAYDQGAGAAPNAVAAAVLLVMAAAAVTLLRLHALNTGGTILTVMLSGVVLRAFYVAATPYWCRQHDVYFSFEHLDYIHHIFAYGSLPDSNTWQFYHPPLHHLVCAAFWYLCNGAGYGTTMIFEGFQCLTAFYSVMTMLVCWKMTQELKMNDGSVLAVMTIIAFNPALVIMSGSINNDALMLLFSSVFMLYLLKWYQDPGVKNTLVLALSMALGMLTKFSASEMAIPAAFVFLVKSVKTLKEKNGGRTARLIGRFALFAAVSIPIGLSYTVRNYVLFGQKPGYVVDLDGPASRMYTGNYGISERFLSLPLNNLFDGRFCSVDYPCDYNLPVYVIKSSSFSEYKFDSDLSGKSIPVVAVNAILIALSLAATVFVLLRDRRRVPFLMMGVVWASQLAFFAYFNVKFPYTCTMDFRYIVPTLFAGAMFIGGLHDGSYGIKRGAFLRAAINAAAVSYAALATVFGLLAY